MPQVPVPLQEVLVPGSDDFRLRAFNHNRQGKEVVFEVHPDDILRIPSIDFTKQR